MFISTLSRSLVAYVVTCISCLKNTLRAEGGNPTRYGQRRKRGTSCYIALLACHQRKSS